MGLGTWATSRRKAGKPSKFGEKAADVKFAG
jgi:hypothetical protein